MDVSYGPLPDVPTDRLLEVLNDARIARHMPLWGAFDAAGVREWALAKAALDVPGGLGPQAVYVDGRFAGWAGIQPEDYGPDFAVVLAPWAWGAGTVVAEQLLSRATRAGLAEVFIALPPTRHADRVVGRLGFTRVADDVDGFIVYRRILAGA